MNASHAQAGAAATEFSPLLEYEKHGEKPTFSLMTVMSNVCTKTRQWPVANGQWPLATVMTCRLSPEG